MTPIAPHITAFFELRLPLERRVSEDTRDSPVTRCDSRNASHLSAAFVSGLRG